jgi:hypothetical protein
MSALHSATLLLAMSAVGCVPTPSTDTGTGTGTGTGTDACPADVEVLTVAMCVETTAPPSTVSTGSYASSSSSTADASGAGTITEVGGALPAFADSARFGQFRPCGPEHTQQVRLVDDTGATWTVGWGIDGPIDDASADAFAVGAPVDFHAHYSWTYFFSSRGVVLSDADGPQFLYETHGVLTDAERGGVTVELDRTDLCVVADPDGDIEHDQVVFTGPDGPVTLRSGQQATVALAARDLDLTVAGSYWYTDCSDGCGESLWTGWESP